MIDTINAIYKLNPTVAVIRGETAYDADGNEVAYDKEAVKVQVEATIQAQIAARQSALNKLMALGLTEEEALALGVK
jgi:hypothetical protein